MSSQIEAELRLQMLALESNLADYKESVRKAANESCTTAAEHCGCVGLLRNEIGRLKGEIYCLREGYDQALYELEKSKGMESARSKNVFEN